jgi:Fe-S-cluster containining protein
MTSSTDLLAEHRAALEKIDEAVARASALAGDELRCRRGCSACCVDGLSVLPVEVALIEASGLRPPLNPLPGMCAFLDEDGACSIYAARPVLCRTHGLALRMKAEPGDEERRGALRVLGDDVSACELNYTGRSPAAAEVLDANRLLMLLVTVDRRFRARAGIADDTSRTSLRAVASALTTSDRAR